MRGNEIGEGFLLPALNRQSGPAGFGLGVGSVLRIVIAYFSGSSWLGSVPINLVVSSGRICLGAVRERNGRI
jgi:hypothetical protein